MKIPHSLASVCAFVTLLVPLVFAQPSYAEEADPSLTQTVNEGETVAPKGQSVEIDAGHVDMGPQLIDGTWTLMVRDDRDASPVWRHIDDVVFRVKDDAKMTVPEGEDYSFIGAQDVWVVPQTEVMNVPWLGWNTQSPSVAQAINGGVNLTYGGHQGEGAFSLFLQSGNFGSPEVLVDPKVETSQSIFVEPNTHTHANWVFTSPGVHLIKMSATATLNDGTTVNDTQILRFAVGAETSSENTHTETDTSTSSDTAAGLSAIARQALAQRWTLTNDAGDAQVKTDSAESAADGGGQSPLLWIIVGGVAAGALSVTALILSARKRAALRREVLDSAAPSESDSNRTEDPQ